MLAAAHGPRQREAGEPTGAEDTYRTVQLSGSTSDVETDESSRFTAEYQGWYTQASGVVRAVASGRMEDFEDLYRKGTESRRKATAGENTKGQRSILEYLQDPALQMVGYTGYGSAGRKLTSRKWDDAVSRMMQQIAILDGLRRNIRGHLLRIESHLSYDIRQEELRNARMLLKQKQSRAAGVIAGVVLEGHLATACKERGLKPSGSNPTIGKYAETLKAAIPLPIWREIQMCGDIRNSCAHKGTTEPSVDSVQKLIESVEGIIGKV